MNWYNIGWGVVIVASILLVYVLAEMKAELSRTIARRRQWSHRVEFPAPRVGTSGLFRDSEIAPCVIWSENWRESTERASTSERTRPASRVPEPRQQARRGPTPIALTRLLAASARSADVADEELHV